MLRLTDIKLDLDHAEGEIRAAVLKRLNLKPQDLIVGANGDTVRYWEEFVHAIERGLELPIGTQDTTAPAPPRDS